MPLLVDTDHGHGNGLDVRRTVEELESTGVTRLIIEDTLLPTPNGGGAVRLAGSTPPAAIVGVASPELRQVTRRPVFQWSQEFLNAGLPEG